MKLAYSVMDVAGMGMGMKNTLEELEQYWGNGGIPGVGVGRDEQAAGGHSLSGGKGGGGGCHAPDFNDMSVSLNDEKVEEAEALLINGVTYIPVSACGSPRSFPSGSPQRPRPSCRSGWNRERSSSPGTPLPRS